MNRNQWLNLVDESIVDPLVFWKFYMNKFSENGTDPLNLDSVHPIHRRLPILDFNAYVKLCTLRDPFLYNSKEN